MNTSKPCLQCGSMTTFKISPSTLLKGGGKFCSRKCQAAYHKQHSGAIRICVVCGAEFYAKGNPKNRKCCSRRCSELARKTSIKTRCDFCQTEIDIPKGRFSKSKNHFCSRACSNNFQAIGKIEYICIICGKSFRVSASTKPRKYCSIECRNKDAEHLSRVSTIGNLSQYKKRGLNKLELSGRDILTSLKIKFREQVSINNKFVVDVLLSDFPIVIQWDGVYWHSKPKRRILDKSQDSYLKKCGYVVLRFTDQEVYKEREKVYANIKRTIRQIA